MKPTCKLIGTNGNAMNLIVCVCKTLKKNELHKEYEEFKSKALNSNSYEDILMLITDYVDVE